MSQIEDIHGKPQYKMVVKGKTFVTIDIIANYRAAGICGTGTRVWLVYEEGFPESRYVLKDMWMPLHSLAEGEQLRRLHLRLEAVNHDAAHHPHDSFLVLLEDGFVTGNDTLSMLGGNDIPVDAPLEQMRQHAPRPSRGKSRTGLPPPPKRTPLFTGRKKIYHRKQYRIVFKDVGTTIYEIKFLSGIMDALSDATKALKLLHNLGLVHRDLSPGNIVVVDGVGKVLDLECLKVYLKDETDEVEICSAVKDHQTASSGFTAVEVEAQSYFFGSPGDVSLESLQTESRVVFNPLHDLESIIWIAIWALTYCSAETAVETSEAQSAVFDDCFGPQAIADTRHRMLTLQWRQPGLASYPPIFHDSIRILIPMLQQLTRQYSEFETTFDLTALKLDETYESFISGYSKMARALQDIPFVTPKSVEGARVRKPAKRSRDTEINEEKGDVGDTTGKVPAKKSKSVGSPSAAAGSSSTTSGPSLARRKSTRLTGKKT
ncbi:hypothetical protein C8R43DRAFT_615336 [Mycena crocata]|nr:hypothetical protein C8R43DRAFT_615336 [Mycena crocata]